MPITSSPTTCCLIGRLPLLRTLTSLAGHVAQAAKTTMALPLPLRLGLALCDLAPTLQPSVVTHGIVQLNHRIWQLRKRSRRNATNGDLTDLSTALRCGDASAAMQLARQAATAGTLAGFNEDLQRFLTQAQSEHALQAGAIVGVLAMSTSPNLDPERAARVAGALADLTANTCLATPAAQQSPRHE